MYLDGDRRKLGHYLHKLLRKDVAVLGNGFEHDRVCHLQQRCPKITAFIIEVIMVGINEKVK